MPVESSPLSLLALRQRQRDLPCVVRGVIQGMREQPHTRHRAEERRLDRVQPIPISRRLYQLLQRPVSTLNQLTALDAVVPLARVALPDRRVLDIRWRAHYLSEQVRRLADVTKNEAD